MKNMPCASQPRAFERVGNTARKMPQERYEALLIEPRAQPLPRGEPGSGRAHARLWHVEITFNAPIAGPLVIRDGRFLGLGAMTERRIASIASGSGR